MNTYRHKFYSQCPNNGQLIEYHFELVTNKMIQVEEIVKGCAVHKMGYHEAIADDLLKVFGGTQTLKAHHHGVDIETTREKVPTKEWARTTLDCRVMVGSRVFEKGVSVQALVDFLTRDDRYDNYDYP